MILVSVGTNEAHFDRLLGWIAGLETDEELVVQHGPSQIRPGGATCAAFVPFDHLVQLVRTCRAFVTHAGVGSIMVSLSSGRKPIVVPRLKRLGEAVDDHQVALARRLNGEGLVTLVESDRQPADALAASAEPTAATPPASTLANDLRNYLYELRNTQP